MSKAYERLLKSFDCIREKTDFEPLVGIVLGSGLGDYGDRIRQMTAIDYCDIEGFPVSTVKGHQGRFIFGYVGEVPVVAMQGRVHYYEGYTMQEVVMPIRIMKMLGIKYLLLTNAAGGIDPTFKAGDLMMITDQISDFVPSPLIGENIDELGERFPDMTHIYDPALCVCMREAAAALSIDLKAGVYIQFSGPNYESPSEVKLAGLLGAGAVGMSTACEAVAANHAGLSICGISLITNMGTGISEKPLSHDEVQAAGAAAAPKMQALVSAMIEKMAKMS